jgi:peroxiredoxin
MVEKLILPFSLLADPDGSAIREYGFWDERQQISRPAIVVVDGSGSVRYVYDGQDFADRPGDEPVYAALDEAAGGER